MRALHSLLLLFLLLSTNVWAQTDLLSQKVSLNVDGVPLKEFIQLIENQLNLNFSYSDNILGDSTTLTRQYQEVTVAEILNDVFAPLNIQHQLVGKSIVLYFKAPQSEWFYLSGFVKDSKNSEDLIGAAIYVEDMQLGVITNTYSYFSIKLPKGNHRLRIYNLGYLTKTIDVSLNFHHRVYIFMESKAYDIAEVVVSGESDKLFLESRLMNLHKMDIEKFKDLPGLFGENDALRNLSIIPGIQSNEISTSSISVRGGGTDQTVFLMDEATLFDASHFGGFFSVFNPDVVSNVNVYKSDIPVSEGGALSSLIDVRLREGNKQNWQVKGGIGIISARGLVEGPLKKDESSMLLAFRRTYVDRFTQLFTNDPDLQKVRFYFYDANLKMNFKLGKNDRLFLSGYSGSDSFTQDKITERTNHLGSLRWNHLFGTNFFSNVSFIVSKNIMKHGTQEQRELLYWQSSVNNVKLKADVSYYAGKSFKGTFGFNSSLNNNYPFSLITESKDLLFTRYESSQEQMLLNSIYLNQQTLIRGKLGVDFGARLTHMYTDPFTDSLEGSKSWYWEPQLRLSWSFNETSDAKASYSRQVQPLHQLPINMIGVAVNRWMIANETFLPQQSDNFSLGIYHNIKDKFSFSAETYYRHMYHLIETMQDQQILDTDDPAQYLFKAEAEALGAELLFSYTWKKMRGSFSYEYNKALWVTKGINQNKAYPASHSREHTLHLSNVYYLNKRISLAATWVLASGIPYTPANGKYQINGRTYLQFDEDHINSKKLPVYHRLDLSLDVESKKNEHRKWKGYWNFAIYNAYLRKNALGVAYYIPDQDSDTGEQKINPGYYYLYRFVPSVSYRFTF
ncbi:MAG: carboxypeptidase-like regulatory domain-containing protein [Salinivirgaceae bacterium]